MSIAPIIRTVQVKVDPARAFDLFATRMAQWWPKGGTIGKAPHADVIIEPRPGGRWFERDAEGNETQWGHVLAWEPPSRLLLAWQISTAWRYDPSLLTEVELTFAPADGGTLVTLEHRHLERFGADAAAHAQRLGGGWPTRLAAFAHLAEAMA
ncbi:SRPBCC family protein [Vineibacter terrae]|uniref:SRPBCC family protein n=1 Tax=Vineibacter terrae TaxID=2586908 RepID=UPI002E3521D9|nr:SRPBCC family protein [Vineibacter terrae]HEX2892202.1 SRPBCC family protein [Vineibacter terrae]